MTNLNSRGSLRKKNSKNVGTIYLLSYHSSALRQGITANGVFMLFKRTVVFVFSNMKGFVIKQRKVAILICNEKENKNKKMKFEIV